MCMYQYMYMYIYKYVFKYLYMCIYKCMNVYEMALHYCPIIFHK